MLSVELCGSLQLFRRSVSRCMYITNAKDKRSIVRKRRAMHAISRAGCKLRSVTSIASPVRVRARRRPSSIFSSVRWRPAKAKSKGYIALRRLACRASIIHTYTGGRVARGRAKGMGVAPRRATMPACTDARMCRVLHDFFHSPLHHTRTYTHKYLYMCSPRRATFPPCTGVYFSPYSRGASYFTSPQGLKAHVWYFYVLICM